MGKKTKVIIENRKFFCDNPDCTFTTFAERFDILEHCRQLKVVIVETSNNKVK